MKVIYGIGKVKKSLRKSILAIGVFDGLHKGHQRLIKKAVARAEKLNGEAVVLTFHPHPVHVLHPKYYLPLIISLPHRIKLLESLGVAKCIILRFTKRFSKLSPQRFIKRYLVDHIHPLEIFVGDDFRFGKNRQGTLDYFKRAGEKYNFTVSITDSIKAGRKKIGSSHIRQLIIDGQLEKAKQLLGRNVSILGEVKKGEARGQSLGFPTANLYPQNELLPPRGVYAVKILFNEKKYNGMANIGFRPSFHKKKKKAINIEVHIFGLRRRLYGQNIIIEFVKKIRNEKFFPTKEKLIEQLKADRTFVKSFLRSST